MALTLGEELAAVVAGKDCKFKATRIALLMEAHLNSDPWALGDALIEDIGNEDGEHGVKSGLYQKLEEIGQEFRAAGVISIGDSRVRESFLTARHWLPEHRQTDVATYEAHRRLRTKEYRGEKGARLLRRLHREHPDRRVTPDDVREWRERQQRAAGKMPAPLSQEQMLDRRLRAALRGWASPQKLNQRHPDEQKAAALILYRLAAEVERGEFA